VAPGYVRSLIRCQPGEVWSHGSSRVGDWNPVRG
jgi:hypothetical protein